MLTQTLSDTQSIALTASPVDASGAPGTLLAGAGPTPPTSSAPSVATITASPTNPLSLIVAAVAPGTCTVTVNAAAPSGAIISESATVIVTGGPATGLVLSFGSPFTTVPAPPSVP